MTKKKILELVEIQELLKTNAIDSNTGFDLLVEFSRRNGFYKFGDLHALMDSEEYFAGEKLYAFGFGEIGFFGGSGWDYVWADNTTQAAQKIRQYYPLGVLSIRLAVYGETDCDNFDLSGHLPH